MVRKPEVCCGQTQAGSLPTKKNILVFLRLVLFVFCFQCVMFVEMSDFRSIWCGGYAGMHGSVGGGIVSWELF